MNKENDKYDCYPIEIFFQQAHVKVHEFQTDQSHKKAFTFVVKSSIFVENGSFNSLCVYIQ